MKMQGAAVSKGVAVGKAFVFTPFKPDITERLIGESDVVFNLSRYDNALAEAGQELTELSDRMAVEDEGKSGIFKAHTDILNDVAICAEIRDLIQKDLYAPEFAIETVYEKFIGILSEMDDDIIRERCADLKDVKCRVLRILMGVENKNLSEINEDAIVFAHDLFPSDTATMNRNKVLAIVTEIGGNTSHSAIIARSYEIPAILGVAGVMGQVKDGDPVIVDALSGEIILNPSQNEADAFTAKRNTYLHQINELKKYQSVEPVTLDGQRIDVCLNIGSVNDDEMKPSAFTDGVGLFRSEFLFMSGKELPSENQQFAVYKKAAETYAERQVILRTLDIGGDKQLECMELPAEDNPFLGCRALRLCFQKEDLFKTQLRAALRASSYGNLAIMFPMVGSLEDFRRAKAILEECKKELDTAAVPYNHDIKVGVMIEIPAIALMADLIADEVDFASVGTNDLCQYLMAVDRLNPEVAIYYESYHPAMFKLISFAAEAFQKAGKTLSICGEMAGDPRAALVFLGMGIKKLSMVTSSIAAIKKMIVNTDMKDAQKAACDVKKMHTAGEIKNYLREKCQA